MKTIAKKIWNVWRRHAGNIYMGLAIASAIDDDYAVALVLAILAVMTYERNGYYEEGYKVKRDRSLEKRVLNQARDARTKTQIVDALAHYYANYYRLNWYVVEPFYNYIERAGVLKADDMVWDFYIKKSADVTVGDYLEIRGRGEKDEKRSKRVQGQH